MTKREERGDVVEATVSDEESDKWKSTVMECLSAQGKGER